MRIYFKHIKKEKDMRHFTYVITKTTRNRINGSRIQTADIYRIKRNVPEYLTTIKWDTGGYYGETTEVMHTLADQRYIPRRFSRSYYIYNDNNEDIITKFIIHKL